MGILSAAATERNHHFTPLATVVAGFYQYQLWRMCDILGGDSQGDSMVAAPTSLPEYAVNDDRPLSAAHGRALPDEAWADSVIGSAPYAVVGIDEGNCVVTWNRAAGMMFGWTAAEIVGQPFSGIIADDEREAHNRSATGICEPAVRWANGYSRIHACNRDGHDVPVGLTIAVRPAGAQPRIVAFILNQSYRYEAEEEIRRLASIVEGAEDAILARDMEGTVIAWNRAAERLYGYSADEVLGRNAELLEAPERAGETRALLASLSAGERIAMHETRRRRKDGQILDVSLTLSPLRDIEGNITGASVIARDISSEKRAEQALLEAQKFESLGVLAGGVAHDFNNLLTSILANTGLLLAGLSEGSPLRESVEDIELTSRRAAELARQLLAYSGRGTLTVEFTDLNALVMEMSHLLGLSIRRGIELHYHIDEHLPLIEADATQIRQVVMNLIVNASDAIEAGVGTITVTTGWISANRDYLNEVYLASQLPEGEYVFLEISDTGKGMDEVTRVRIFDPFFTTKPAGRGLGLAAVLGIIRGHGGAIRVYSETGHGTTFKILLPAAGRPENHPATARAAAGDLGGHRVLVIDDEEHVRRVAARALATWGIDVVTAANGAEGIELLGADEGRIVLVLLDLTMPGLSGAETFMGIHEIRPGLPIVVMSGYNEYDVADRLPAHGRAGFVQKPFQLVELREAVVRALEDR